MYNKVILKANAHPRGSIIKFEVELIGFFNTKDEAHTQALCAVQEFGISPSNFREDYEAY